MSVVIDLLDQPDPCSLVALIGLLTCIGSYMTVDRRDLWRWGYRLAGATFVAYCAYGIWLFAPTGADELLGIAVRGLLGAGLTLGTSWIVLAVSAFLVQAPAAVFDRWRRSARQRLADERAQRERAEKLRREREEYERAAPERERARNEATARAQLQAQAQKRRAAARAHCEFLYHLYSPEIEARFPRHKFDDFVTKYLSDCQSPEEVDAHGEKLRTLMDAHVKKADPRPGFKTLRDLTDWYADQKSQIDGLPNGPLKSSLIATLHARYAELSFQLLEELSP